MKLASLPTSLPRKVVGIKSGCATAQRLMELGVIRGLEVEVLGRAPFGDPLRVRLGTTTVALRSTEASLIEVDE